VSCQRKEGVGLGQLKVPIQVSLWHIFQLEKDIAREAL
jgi:hypothetical protein